MTGRSFSDSEEYEANVQKLQQKWEKKKRSSKSVWELMDLTFDGRRQWITTEEPPISDVVRTFPPLSNHEMVYTFYFNPSHAYTCVYAAFIRLMHVCV